MIKSQNQYNYNYIDVYGYKYNEKGEEMAFDNTKNKISNMLKSTEVNHENEKVQGVIDNFERTKQYQFTLQPSVREKINQLAKEAGYRSASSYLNDYFKKL